MKKRITEKIRKLIKQAQYYDVDPDMLLLLFQDFLKETQKDWNYILPTELYEKLQKKELNDYFLLDIRRPEDFNEVHIPGTVNIFWLDVLKKENLEKIPINKEIIVICYVGHTSSQIMVMLSMLGYRCKSLKFGMGKSPDPSVEIKGWLGYHYPVI